MIAYRAMLDVPKELIHHLAGLLAAERRVLGTRRKTRALTCWYHALLVLVWYRKGEDLTLLAAGFGVSRATAYRYRDEATRVLGVTAPDLNDALRRVAADGWSHVILDGKVFSTDRCAETTTSVKGRTIDAWYSGKHRHFGANIQAIMRPDGLPIWTSPASPGHLHDLTVAADHGVLGALYWSASELDLPTLADSGYESAGHGVYTPVKNPGDGKALAVGNRAYNLLLRATRCHGERGFALLTQRWRTLQHTTASPSRVDHFVRAALVLTHFEHRYLPIPC